tara:strand:- start:673 stop:4359 length:3687 start_codon:yes stop_codon:yes gene_type:complete
MDQTPNNTNTILIDANRRTSQESIAGNDTNPAQWTNEASAGIRLNVGDKVSVHSSFISEIGCGDQALETSGKSLRNEATYEYTEIIPEIGERRYEYGPYSSKSVEVKTITKTVLPRDNEMRFTMSYYKNTNGENYIHLPRRFDTDQIVTANGLYQRPYTNDPVKTYAPSAPLVISTEYPYATHPNGDPNRDGNGYYLSTKTQRQKTWWQADSFASGKSGLIPQYRCPDDWHFYIGKAGYTGWSKVHNTGTYVTGDGGGSTDEAVEMKFGLPKNVHSDNYNPGPTVAGSRGYDVNEWRPRNNNSRYTIFMMNKTVYDLGSANADWFASYAKLEPCNHNYIKYVELKEYSIKTGFNDPNNVAYQLTSQITDKSEPETIYLNQYLNTNLQAPVEPRYDCPISMAITGETFKPFACANWATLGKTQFDDYVAPSANQEAIDYLSSYQTIGVKRPELFITGRNMFSHYYVDPKNPTNTELQDWYYFRIGEPQNDLNYFPGTGADENGKWLPTTIPFTSDNLKGISAFLKAQALYPELLVFDKRNNGKTTVPIGEPTITLDDMPYMVDTPPLTTSLDTNTASVVTGIDNPVDDKRFLHMSGRKDGDDEIPTYGPEDGRIPDFGNDGYITPTLPVVNPNLAASQPIFFHYDKSNEERDELEVTGLSEHELVYGFAGVYTDSAGNNYIRLYVEDSIPYDYLTELIGGGPAHGNPGPYYVYERAIGYDNHFNAYGNSAIALYSGQLPETFDGLSRLNAPKVNGGSTTAETGQAWDISKYIRQVYLGAIQPLINFDTAQSRFTIGGLHTPEYIQNDADAGKLTIQPTATDPTGLPVDVTADAGTPVYKINKILQTGNNWSPNMNPYKSKTEFTVPLNKLGDVKVAKESATIVRSNTVSVFAGYEKTTRQWLSYNGAEPGLNPLPPDAWGGPGPQPTDINGTITGTTSPISAQQELIEANRNLDYFTIFDSQCGVALESYGIVENDWEHSIWGIMGWSYNQLAKVNKPVYTITGGNIGELNRQTRLSRRNSGLIRGLTTNADVGLNDIPLYNKNVWDKSMYTLQMPTPEEPNIWFGYNNTSTEATKVGSADVAKSRLTKMIDDVNVPNIYPNIVVPQTTALIVAEGLPIKMSSPYYLIKSNIIADSYYMRDTTPLPIVSVVNKENGFGDFYFQGPSQLEFTITQDITLTFILTEIYDSDMTFARVDKNSAVIYKIEKSVPSNINIIDEVIAATKSKATK